MCKFDGSCDMCFYFCGWFYIQKAIINNNILRQFTATAFDYSMCMKPLWSAIGDNYWGSGDMRVVSFYESRFSNLFC